MYQYLLAFGLVYCLFQKSLLGQNSRNPYQEFKPISEKINHTAVNKATFIDNDGILSTEYEKLTGYTHEELSQYLKDEDLIQLWAKCSRYRDDYFLDIEFIFKTEKAYESYGGMHKGAVLKLKLLNSETLYLHNVKNSRGKVSKKNNQAKFTGSYLFDEYEVKQLLKSPVMQVEVAYRYGTEAYATMDIALLKQQLLTLTNEQYGKN